MHSQPCIWRYKSITIITFGSFSPQGISFNNKKKTILFWLCSWGSVIILDQWKKKANSLIDRSFVFNANSKICSSATHMVDSAEANFNKTCYAFLLFYQIKVAVMWKEVKKKTEKCSILTRNVKKKKATPSQAPHKRTTGAADRNVMKAKPQADKTVSQDPLDDFIPRSK